MTMSSKGQAQNLAVWIVVGILALFAFNQGLFDNFTGVAGAGTGDGAADTGDGVFCPDITEPITVGPQSARWNPSTSVSAVNAQLYVNDGIGTSQSDSATKTVTEGDTIELIYGLDATSYYGAFVEFTAPCGAVDTKKFSTANKEHELIANGSISVTVRNQDTGTNNDGTSAGANETILEAGDGTFTFEEFSTADKTGFSPYGKIFITVEMNGSAYDEEKTTFIKDGVALTSGSTPSFHTLLNLDSKTRTFTVDGCPNPSTDTRKCSIELGVLNVQAASGVNPAGAGTQNAGAVGAGDIRVCFNDEDWDVHTISDRPRFDVEDDTGTASGFGEQCVFLTVD